MLNVIRLFAYIVFFSLTAEAKFDLFLTQKLYLPQDYVQDATALTKVSNKVANSLTIADSSRTIVSKIIDSSLSYWWDTSGIKNTTMGQAVDTVQNKMKADVNLGSTSNTEAVKTQHKLSFRILAAQALAKIEYLGWVKAVFKYDAKQSMAEAELFENLSNNKDLIFSHSISSAESKSQVSLRWNW